MSNRSETYDGSGCGSEAHRRALKMIFGFNTDIKHDETVYHVQSEAREHEHLLQTQVFVRGQCIGKHARSYGELLRQPGFSHESMHELLKLQHRRVIDAIRDGHLDELLASAQEFVQNDVSVPSPIESPAVPVTEPEAPASELELQFLNPDEIRHRCGFVLRFRLSDCGSAVAGAKLLGKVTAGGLAQPVYAQASTREDGTGELQIFSGTDPAAELTVLVQASYGGRTSTRKLILRATK